MIKLKLGMIRLHGCFLRFFKTVQMVPNGATHHILSFVDLSRLKGYLRYKMITSQIVSSRLQIENVSFSRYSNFCIFNHPMMCQICDIMVSIST